MMRFETGSTREAENFVEANKGTLGNIISVKHRRKSNSIYYQTIITGENNSMEIIGGLTSGYTGGGPHGLIRVLESIGLDEETATRLVKGNSDDTHEFEYKIK